MKLQFYSALLLSSSVLAANSTYKVVTLDPNYTRYGVTIDNTTYPLNQSPDSPLLYTGQAPSGSSYSYCVLDAANAVIQQELVARPALAGNESLNEVYNRTNNIVGIPSLPKLWDDVYKTDVSNSLHIDGQIAVIHIQGNESEIEAIHTNTTSEEKVAGNMTVISPTGIKFVKDIKFDLAGRSSRMWPKQSYTINVKKDGDLDGLTKFKLRSAATDPTFMREKLYYDMLRLSAGLPANGASWARVLFNNRPAGFFLFVDQPDKKWLDATYNDKGNGSDTGILYMGNYGAPSLDSPVFLISDLSYLGDNQTLYGVNETYKIKEKSSDKKDEDFTKLAEFTKTIQNSTEWNTTTWNEFMDVDLFLKHMAFEFFNGHMDGYLNNANNYLLYDNNKRWTWLSSDLDFTMGNFGSNQTALTTGDYTQYANTTRPLLKDVLAVPEFNTTYREYVTKIEQELYRLDILGPRIDGFKSFIEEDVNWDATLERLSQGITANTTSIGDIPLPSMSQIPNGTVTAPGGGIAFDVMAFAARMNATNITFDAAVNGETNYTTLYGLKQWIENKSLYTNQSLSATN
ncbi:coth protein-domain-containing protein [Umbelopsis sp. AD052]|nr:coth protein-domain-containing protein [Umbelopsis sp. AD052]